MGRPLAELDRLLADLRLLEIAALFQQLHQGIDRLDRGGGRQVGQGALHQVVDGGLVYAGVGAVVPGIDLKRAGALLLVAVEADGRPRLARGPRFALQDRRRRGAQVILKGRIGQRLAHAQMVEHAAQQGLQRTRVGEAKGAEACNGLGRGLAKPGIDRGGQPLAFQRIAAGGAVAELHSQIPLQPPDRLLHLRLADRLPLLEEAGGVRGAVLDGREQVHRLDVTARVLGAQKDRARQLRQRDRAGAGRLLLGDGAVDDLALREDLVAVAQKTGLVCGVLAAVGKDQDALLAALAFGMVGQRGEEALRQHRHRRRRARTQRRDDLRAAALALRLADGTARAAQKGDKARQRPLPVPTTGRILTDRVGAARPRLQTAGTDHGFDTVHRGFVVAVALRQVIQRAGIEKERGLVAVGVAVAGGGQQRHRADMADVQVFARAQPALARAPHRLGDGEAAHAKVGAA